MHIGNVATTSTPALGDVNGDGVADIVVVLGPDPQAPTNGNRLAAYGHDDSVLWVVPFVTEVNRVQAAVAIALADLDHDGVPEVIAGREVHAADGTELWTAGDSTSADLAYNAPSAVDLDGDGYLEVVLGSAAYRHDGSVFYENADVLAATASDSNPMFTQHDNVFNAVADLDGDGLPEIVVTTMTAVFVLSNTGQTLHRTAVTTTNSWPFPPAIAVLTPGGAPDILVSDGNVFRAYAPDLSERWSMPVSDQTGIAASTAFDFLGDGTAEAMYADEQTFWVFDGQDGHTVLSVPRLSRTLIEYPVVADVDNDGSADVLLVSISDAGDPGVQMISDRQRRWVPARRIYNQDTYHVTNVNEDGTIPMQEAPHFRASNTFRAQAQIDRGGHVCAPAPE
jgi:hypothetical protein